MPWLSIISFLLTFFAAGGAKPEKRRQALLAAGLAGAATYGVTHYTDWGQANLGRYDGVVVGGPSTPIVYTEEGGASVTANPDGSYSETLADGTTRLVAAPIPGAPGSVSSGLSGALSKLASSPLAGVAAGAVAASALPSWALPAALALGVVFLVSR